jgi:peptidoglycan/LPS O-acetylase OafA/YrhL
MQDAQRVTFLDGLRGIAALQVVGLHYFSAFLPAIALVDPTLMRHAWEARFVHSPVFATIDGYASVYVFFLISGAALTYSYASQPFAVAAGVGRRLVRLGIPMAASVLLAALLFWLLPTAHVAAGHLTGSVGWLAAVGPKQIAWWPVLKEIFFYGLFTGHAGPLTSLWPASFMAAWQVPRATTSFNSPLWTLHFEFFGSLLILLLVAMRSLVGPTLHRIMCLLLLAVFAIHPFGLFIIGHLVAPVLTSPRWRAMTQRGVLRGVGIAALGCGLAMASYGDWPWVTRLCLLYTRQFGWPGMLDPFHTQSLLEALLLFTGVIMLAPVQRLLATPLARWCGRISFSLYLTHFPILFTVTSVVFVASGGTPAAAVIAVPLGLAISITTAGLFERWVDRPAIHLSRRIVGFAAKAVPGKPVPIPVSLNQG